MKRGDDKERGSQFPNETGLSNVLYTAEVANSMITDPVDCLTFRTAPVFSATEEMLNPSSDSIVRTQQLYEILAYRIPALSPAMGACVINNPQFENSELAPKDPSKWRKGHVLGERWLHSDIKNMTYLNVEEEFKILKTSLTQPRKEE